MHYNFGFNFASNLQAYHGDNIHNSKEQTMQCNLSTFIEPKVQA